MNITTYYMNIIKKLSPQLLFEAQAFADDHSADDAFHVSEDFPLKDSSAIASMWIEDKKRLQEENRELKERLDETRMNDCNSVCDEYDIKELRYIRKTINEFADHMELAYRRNNRTRLKKSVEMWTLTQKGLPKDGCLCWIYTKDSNIAPARFRLHSLSTQGRSDRRAFECDFSCRAYPVSEVVSWIYMKRPTYPYPGNIACV